ncbi:MAG: hypothetical protein ACTSR8_19020 [Promethearchaeota archaeon]
MNQFICRRNSRRVLLFTIIFSMFIISMINIPFNQKESQNNLTINRSSKSEDTVGVNPLISKLDNNDRLNFTENIAKILRAKWILNKWNESNDYIELSQSGVAGIGDYFIDLYNTTLNATYLNWAEDVGKWLLNIRDPAWEVGKWPNRIGTQNYYNYSGYEKGVAGIGSFFVNLYKITGNNTYLSRAEDVHTYLVSIEKQTPSGKGYVWAEKEGLILNDAPGWPSINESHIGTPQTNFDNILSYDGSTYDIASSGGQTDVDYKIDLLNTSIPNGDLNKIDDYISQLTVSISVQCDVNPSGGSDILIYNYGNESWMTVYEDGIINGVVHLEKTFYSGFSNFTDSGTPYITIKVNTSDVGAHLVGIDALNISIDYNNEYNSSSYSIGAAGIGKFYLNLYSATSNNIYLTKASGAANYTLEQAITIDGKAAWKEDDVYYTGTSLGAAGIGNFLLDIYNAMPVIVPSYLTMAKRAADWLISNNATLGITLSDYLAIRSTNGSTPVETGMKGMAGIGQFILDLGLLTGLDYYVENASKIGNWLTTLTQVVVREEEYSYQYLYYKWRATRLGTISYDYSTGTAGALVFLNNIFLANKTSKHGKYLSGGVEWIKATITDFGNNTYSISSGLAGIGKAFLEIDYKRPTISNYNVLSEYEYDSTIELSFSIDSEYSTINNVYIIYAYGADYNAGIWTQEECIHVSGAIWSFTFEYISYGEIIHYGILAEDSNTTFSFDYDNGNFYSIAIVDTAAPYTEIAPSWEHGLGSGEEGEFDIKVKKENVRGAQFDYVEIEIPGLVSKEAIQVYEFDLNNGWYRYTYEIETPEDVEYGDSFVITVKTYDEASNTLTTIYVLNIIDNDPPLIMEFDDAYASWIPQFTEVEISAEFSDIGSGIDENEGVYLLYTIDEGNNWQTVYLEKSGNKYIGKIPGQFLLTTVYYVVGAEDKEGNSVLYDKYYTSYENIEDIELEAMWSYDIIINWTVIFIIMGIIAVIVVIGYLIYSKKGGYLEKMRRKSKYTATGIVIKERLTNFYYKLYDRFNALGERLVKAGSGGFGKIGLWFEEHLGDKTRSVFNRIGRFLIGIPLGILHAIGYFFKGIGRLLTKTKVWQIFVFIIFGFLILITTVIQFIMEGGYPIRAVFFANLGFLMVLMGIATLLLQFIYKLTYK